MSLLVLSRKDVTTVLETFTPMELEKMMAKAFHLLSNPSPGTVLSNPARITMAMASHDAMFMPARICDSRLSGAAIKAVALPRESGGSSTAKGLPASTLVFDEHSGSVKAIINARSLTAMRNASGSLLSARAFLVYDGRGERSIRKVAFFGAGQQIEAHLLLFCRAYSATVEECMIINRTIVGSERVNNLVSLARDKFPLVRFTPVAQTETGEIAAFLGEADVVICATPSQTPLFPSSWIADGTHVILVGSYTRDMHEVDSALVHRAVSTGVLVVDSWEACSREAGELIAASLRRENVKEIGSLVEFDDGGELILAAGMWNADGVRDVTGWGKGVSIFKSVGVAVQDVAIACEVVNRAAELGGIGNTIDNYD